MENGPMKYDFAGIDSMAANIESLKSRLIQSHSELTQYVRSLVAQWEGQAQQSYAAVQAKWDATHEDLLATLGRIATTVRSGSQDMSATESRLAAAWAGA